MLCASTSRLFLRSTPSTFAPRALSTSCPSSSSSAIRASTRIFRNIISTPPTTITQARTFCTAHPLSLQASSQSSSSKKKKPAAMPTSGPKPRSLILTLSCPDQVGIVSSVSSWLASGGFNIRDSAQFGDDDTKQFFMRVWAEEIQPPSDASHNSDESQRRWVQDVSSRFQGEMADKFKMQFQIHGKEEKPRTLIMVSKIGHCLNDLLFRLKAGTLPISVPLIVSNHAEYKALAEQHGIPFYHLPISAAEGKTKEWQEEQIVKLCDEHKVELVVLARYMQILSPKLCELMSGRIINIHHSFLPSFKGAKPYHQAYERGVKLIGATAHIVTSDLDEGPIIEQNVERVNHNHSPADLVLAGSDVEARVLARAVKWYAERRVLLNGAKTVVFA